MNILYYKYFTSLRLTKKRSYSFEIAPFLIFILKLIPVECNSFFDFTA